MKSEQKEQPEKEPEYIITDGVESHEQRCDNNCPRKGCYFHPNMNTKERGLDIDHVITIPEFIRRFGCATYFRPLPSALTQDTTGQKEIIAELED